MYFIALKMLIFDRAKYFGLIFTIAIATFLMAQQLSIFIAVLNRSASQIIDIHEANIWVMDPKIQYFEEIKPMRDIELYRVRSIQGVDWAVPFFKSLVMMSVNGYPLHKAYLYGVDDVSLVGKPKMLLGSWASLRLPNSIIIDKDGWIRTFGDKPYQLGGIVQINDRRMTIVGIANPSPPFFSFPIIFTRFSEAIQLSPQGRDNLSFILVKSGKGFSPKNIAKRITSQTGLQALTSNQLIWKTIHFIVAHTPIPFNFGLTILLGFLIGTVVVGQTFYIFLLENLRQFGLLKAVGMTNKQILSMVVLQAIWIGLIGFGIGIGLCAIISEFLAVVSFELQGLFIPWQVILLTGMSVIIIILLASLVGIRQVFSVDPAIVFKG